MFYKYKNKKVEVVKEFILKNAASESISVDLKAFEKKEPELYADLLKDYTKITKRSASVSYTFKKEA